MLKYLSIGFFVITYTAFATGDYVHGDVALKPDEKYSVPGKCMEMRCRPDGTIIRKACPAMNPNPKMDCVYIPEDYSKPYPQYCDWYKCTEKTESK